MDRKGRVKRERAAASAGTPETVKKLDCVTIDRLAENGWLLPEHVTAWAELHDGVMAMARGIGVRCQQWERRDPGRSEISDKQERLIRRYCHWWDHMHFKGLGAARDIVLATIEGYALKAITGKGSFERVKARLRQGLAEYAQIYLT